MARFSQPDPSRATRRTVLTALVAVIVISFAIAAVAGITVLLIGPEGDLMSRVLVTTLIVGGFSIGALSCLALWGRPAHSFGVAGAGEAALGGDHVAQHPSGGLGRAALEQRPARMLPRLG